MKKILEAKGRKSMTTKKSVSCKHQHFWIISEHFWCPDCGAIRRCSVEKESLVSTWKKWLYPRGHDKTLTAWEKLTKK